MTPGRRAIDLGSTGDSGFVPSLAAVEPTDAARVYLRITSVPGDSRTFEGLAVTLDGGTTWKVPLLVSDGSLAGFARLDDGTLLAVGSTPLPGAPPVPAAFVSDDGGQSFTTRSLPVHALGLGQRNGTLFAPTNTAADGFALASSVDRGASWQPRLRFADIAGVKDCVHASCQQGCTTLAAANLFPAATCGSSADASAGDAVSTATASAGSCACALASAPTGVGAFEASVPALLILAWTAATRTTRRLRDAADGRASPRHQLDRP